MATSEEIEKAMLDAFGANDEQSTVTTFLDTGYPPLNDALSSNWGHGLPVGRAVEIYGPESSGKTAICTYAMASAQRMGGFAGFCDHERSFDEPQGVNLGLDISPGRWRFKKPRTFEDSINVCLETATFLRAKKLIAPEAPIAWGFDSLASMVPQSALFEMKGGKQVGEKDATQRSMHDNTALARATSAHFPAFVQQIDELGICAIFLNQIRMDINVKYGNPETTPGGKSPKYYYSQRISLGAAKITKGTGSAATVIGSEITAKVIKNKVSRPFKQAKWRFEFQDDGSGHFAVERSLIDFLTNEGILKKSGAWVVWTDGKKYYPAILAEKIIKDGTKQELMDLLPANYKAPDFSDDEEDEN